MNTKSNISKFHSICSMCNEKYLIKYKLLHDHMCPAKHKQIIETNLKKISENNFEKERLLEEEKDEITILSEESESDDFDDDDSDDDEENSISDDDSYGWGRKKRWKRSYSEFYFYPSRKERGLTEKMFLIEYVQTDLEFHKKFIVMGATGNVYDVTITNKPTCTCPDYKNRQKRCKHIYFVLMKVMKIDQNNTQGIFSNKTLKLLFNNIPDITSNLIVNRRIKEKYDKLTAKENSQIEEEKEDLTKVKSDATEDICPICLESLKDGGKLVFCKNSCGKYIHEECFKMWCLKNEAKCVFCRHPWPKSFLGETNKNKNSEYINLLDD